MVGHRKARGVFVAECPGPPQHDVADWLGQYEERLAGLLNTRSFVAPGAGHVVMGGAIGDGTKAALSSWLMQTVTDDPAWGDPGGWQ
jgi:hypothetical protein